MLNLISPSKIYLFHNGAGELEWILFGVYPCQCETPLPPLTRQERAAKAQIGIRTHFSNKQQLFLDFVLSHYVNVGVEELDQDKLTPLLRLKYHDSIADAVADLGRPDEISKVFTDFQKYLYQQQAAG